LILRSPDFNAGPCRAIGGETNASCRGERAAAEVAKAEGGRRRERTTALCHRRSARNATFAIPTGERFGDTDDRGNPGASRSARGCNGALRDRVMLQVGGPPAVGPAYMPIREHFSVIPR
jgi:hypothetical protein